jgi:hypothetical protein
MKFTIILIFTLVASFVSLAQTSFNHCSLDELFDRSSETDSLYYPRLIDSDELNTKLINSSEYPNLAKRRKLNMLNIFKVTIDTNGCVKKITKTGAKSIFDSSSIKIIMASNGHWRPSYQNGVKKEMEITTTVNYKILRPQILTQLIYNIHLLGAKKAYWNSTDTSPATLILKNQKETIRFDILDQNASNWQHMYILSQKDSVTNYLFNTKFVEDSDLLGDWEYGTVTYGFDIDTNGVLYNLELVNSYSEKLDEDALKFFRSKENIWLPAIKNGVKHDSHLEFDIYYSRPSPNPKTSLPAPLSDLVDAQNFIQKNKHEKALKLLLQLCRYYIRDPEVFFMRGMCYLKLKNIDKACDDLNYTLFLAEQYGYPENMNKEKVREFIEKYCGIVEKVDVED